MEQAAALVFARTLQQLHLAETAVQVHALATQGLKQLKSIARAARNGTAHTGLPPLHRLLREHRDIRLRHVRHAVPRPAAGPLEFFLLQAIGLTPRECEVLGWVAHGKRDAEIATILGISPRTVGKHVEHLLAKLHVETRTAAAHAAHHRVRQLGGSWR